MYRSIYTHEYVYIYIYLYLYTGTVSRYAPSSAEGIFDALYEIAWEDGEMLYYGEYAYQSARRLYEQKMAEFTMTGGEGDGVTTHKR
jgi:hypothetical protein